MDYNLAPNEPTILKPGLDLSLGKIKCLWQIHSFMDIQIFVNLKMNDKRKKKKLNDQ